MTREDVVKTLRLLVASYPNFHPIDMTDTADSWAALLEEYDGEKVLVAVKRYILCDTSGFAPSIGQIVGLMQDAEDGGGMTELEAWSMVSRAIGKSGYNAQEEFDALPPVIQKAVGSAGNLREWAMMDTDTVQSVVQSHVIRNYRVAKLRMREAAKLPPKLRVRLQDMKRPTEKLPEKVSDPSGESPVKEVRDIPKGAQRKLDELRRRWGHGKAT